MKNRILLIEFVVVDRFHCGIHIPYINGDLKRRGFKTVYLRAGLLSKDALTKENRVNLDEETEENIIQELARHEDAVILFSHLPSNRFIRRVGGFTKDIYFVETFDNNSPNVGEFYRRYLIDERSLFTGTPDFSFYNINKLSWQFRPLPHLILFNECNYKRSLGTNPAYSDVNLPDGVKGVGCTFCVNPNIFHKEKFDPEKIRDHILSALTTTPWGTFRRRLRIIGELIIYHIDSFIDILLREGIDETDLLFNCRVDNFIKNRERIESALRALLRTKNRLYLALVGIENFSNEELQRYNKGFYNYDIFKFLSVVFELKNRYPKCFDFSEYGGFSLILFNPFTRLEDLRLNYHIIKYLSIENLCGKLFTSRIRLYEGLPFYHLVKDAGLIVNHYKESGLDTARWNFYKREIPWRYKDKRVERFNLSILGERDNSLDKIIVKLSGYTPLKNNHIRPSLLKAKVIGLKDYYLLESKFMAQYPDRKVGKVEIQTLDEAIEHIKEISKFFRYYERTENRSGVGGLRYSVFYGVDKRSIKRCIELTALLEDGIGDDREQRAYYEVGRLLGYPECCSGIYAREERYKINIYLFMLLYQRYRCQRISPHLNPSFDLFFIPCNLNCKAAASIVQIKNRIAHKYLGIDYSQYYSYPIIFLLPFLPKLSRYRDIAEYVVVEPKSAVGDEFYYRPVFYSGEDERLRYILSSNRVVLRDGFMELFYNRRLLYTFCVEANVWYYRKALDYNFWRAFTEAYYATHIYGQHLSETVSSDDRFADTKSLIRRGSSVFQGSGFNIVDMQIQQNVLSVLLRKMEKMIELRIQSATESKGYFKMGAKYAISIGRSNTEQFETEDIVQKMLSLLEKG